MRLDLHGSRIIVGAALGGAGAEHVRAAAAGRRIALISDAHVMPLHGGVLADALGVPPDDTFTVPAGEASKSREEWARLTDAMLARGFGRDSVVVATGGGVVGDLAGFVAATYMRGVPVVQVPTTLLAMIDASVGGKTGVDTPAGKNLVGAFHQPALVLADPAVLATLPPRELRNGLAEALKHAVITSRADFDWLLAAARDVSDPAQATSDTMARLVAHNIAIKAGIVARDEREAGPRKTLNFGHTIGHAIEAVAQFAIPHGECVGIGMRVEARIAAALGLASPSLEADITSALVALGLPTRPAATMAPQDVLDATRSDKKSRGHQVEYALARAIGAMAGADSGFGTVVPDREVLAALTACIAG
ncbi:MAG TPA: 3-dehydroquinate synthase [Gemmatimonadaceae bacterium]|nr:3-dehydroquinate synthase [Gemmatimonadaceae bacterium]